MRDVQLLREVNSQKQRIQAIEERLAKLEGHREDAPKPTRAKPASNSPPGNTVDSGFTKL